MPVWFSGRTLIVRLPRSKDKARSGVRGAPFTMTVTLVKSVTTCACAFATSKATSNAANARHRPLGGVILMERKSGLSSTGQDSVAVRTEGRDKSGRGARGACLDRRPVLRPLHFGSAQITLSSNLLESLRMQCRHICPEEHAKELERTQRS